MGDPTIASGEIDRVAQVIASEKITVPVITVSTTVNGAGFNGISSVPMSFETNEQTATKIFFPFAVTINKIRGIAMKAIAGTDNGTIQGANATGDSTGGLITATASDAINTEYTATPTTNNTVAAASYYKLTSAKTTAGGKVLVTLEYSRQ